MSTKQFISAEEHLAKLDVTVQEANDFIVANIDQPETLFFAALDHGVTTQMLSDITNNPSDEVCNYFASSEFDCSTLDDTSILLNSEACSLENLVNFNEAIGTLSNESIKEQVLPLLTTIQIHEAFFGPVYHLQRQDDEYDATELGAEHINSIPATNENIESLFYGTLINVFSAIDKSELMQINEFPEGGNTEDFQTLFLDTLNDIPDTVVWTEEEIFELVTEEAADIMNGFFGSGIIGRLDPLLLGFETN